MDSSSTRHLAFLLSLGGIPLACTGDDQGEGSESATTTASTSAAGETSGGTMATGETSSSGATTDATSDGSSGTTGATTSTSFLTTNSTGETSDPTGDVGSGCEGWASNYVECEPGESYEELLAYCEVLKDEYTANYGAECEAAFSEFIDCYAALTCAELEQGEKCASLYYALYELCAPEPGEGCLAFEQKYVECLGDVGGSPATDCQFTVNDGLEEYGEACGQAHEDFYACLTALDCADFDLRQACEKQQAAIEEVCI